MSVDPIRLGQIANDLAPLQKTNSQPVDQEKVSGKADPAAEASLNQSAGLRQLISTTPPTTPSRADRIAALRMAIAQGTYPIPIEQLARILVGYAPLP
jgi:anti-sigma28 factor (negative regulator of flagellin synthesis)